MQNQNQNQNQIYILNQDYFEIKILISLQAAKNLMNAVVLTVKASYVASTKYRKLETKVLMPLLQLAFQIALISW